MSKKKKPPAGSDFRRVLSNNFFLIRIAFSEAPLFTLHSLLNFTKNRIALFWERVVLLNYILDAMQYHKPFRGVFFMALSTLVVLILIEQVYVQYIETKVQPKAMEKISRCLRMKLYNKAATMDLRCYDDPTFYNDFVWAMNEADKRIYDVMDCVALFLSGLVLLLLSGAYLFSNDRIGLPLIFVSIVANVLIYKAFTKKRKELLERMKPHERKRDYVARVFYLADHAKEIRLNKVKGRLYKDFHHSVSELEKETKRGTWSLVWLPLLNSFVFRYLLIDFGYFLYLLYKTIVLGVFSYGTMVSMFNACNTATMGFFSVSDMLPKIQEHSLYIEKIRAFLDNEISVKSPEHPRSLPDDFQSLELKNISFSYNGANVLNNVNLHINKGDRVALVGFNGAGKTTLVKLLMRLYDVNDGTILLNGTDIREFDLVGYRSLFSTVFQDYQLFASSIKDNIVMDTTEPDIEALENAVNAGGFSDKLGLLKNELDTQLTCEFDDDGVQLSGGESQSLAISRALYRASPILILDEPSSALDPIAEYNLNKRMMECERDKTIIMISHRLSTTKNADRIYMFADGEIAEQGTHNELIALGSKYAEMFNLQAEKYREVPAGGA